ncbi:MAG: hypothetical protein HY318_17190 [Armatimonadetes bacterium]|nr:hypothetical protein [Armatimonadota bacterium]
MAGTATLRVSTSTRKRLTHLAKVLGQTPDRVIDSGLEAIERDMFWEGWDEEAASYLQQYGAREFEERRFFSGSNADGEDR